jgi:hypothetical protein
MLGLCSTAGVVSDSPGPTNTQFLLLGTFAQLGSPKAAPAAPKAILSAIISAISKIVILLIIGRFSFPSFLLFLQA